MKVEIFKNVIALVEKGSTIIQASKDLGIPRGSFYSNLTDIQKQELKHAKKLHSMTSRFGWRSKAFLTGLPEIDEYE